MKFKYLFVICLCVSMFGTISAQTDTISSMKAISVQTEKKLKTGKKTQTKKNEPIVLTQAEFAKLVFDYKDTAIVYKGNMPAIVDFYADWCGPCKRLAPILQEILTENEGQIVVYKVNIDHNKELARALQIRNIPTILFLTPKQTPKRAVGLLTKAQIQEIIDTQLLTNKRKK